MSCAHYDIQRLKTFALDTAVEYYVYDPDETALTAVMKVRDKVLSVMNSFHEEGGCK